MKTYHIVTHTSDDSDAAAYVLYTEADGLKRYTHITGLKTHGTVTLWEASYGDDYDSDSISDEVEEMLDERGTVPGNLRFIMQSDEQH